MILGIFPEQGGSIANLARTGQDTRFIQSYLARYAQAFDHVYYFSYSRETPVLPPNCEVIPNPGYHRWAYALRLPFVQRRYIERCDVFRVMQIYGALPAILTKLRYGKPFVATYGYRYFDLARDQEPLWRAYGFYWRARLGAQLADRVIVTTPEMGDYVAHFTPREKLLLIPNGVDTERFAPLASPPAATSDRPKTIIHIGRLSPEKNLAMLIDAIALLAPLPLKLQLVGQGPLHAALQAHAQAKAVTVEFTGIVPNDTLPSLLNQADLFVLPSLGEGHPKALLEAMSCGLPCLGGNVAGTRDVIRHEENGLLCDLTAENLAAAIRRLLTDHALAVRLGQAARNHITDQYVLERLIDRESQAMQATVQGGVANKGGRDHAAG